MSRRAFRLQLLIGWLPVWGLVTAIVATIHGTSLHTGALIALQNIVAAALPALVVQRLTERFPWPRPVSAAFVAMHVAFALAYAFSWLILGSVIESVLRRQLVIAIGPGFTVFLVAGVCLYVMVAGVSYAIAGTERAARAEATTARAQLSALRSQLNPHFLFNVLHTVVQLIPREPARAAQAAEQLAGLLRATIEEDRDLVAVSEELSFVEQYLDIERIRFGDRLCVHIDVGEAARAALVPVFAIQTLVENAVRHGASPRVEPTDVSISASLVGARLKVVVRDTGNGVTAAELDATTGTGLRRLRERLAVLYGSEARFDLASSAGGGFSATLTTPHAMSDA